MPVQDAKSSLEILVANAQLSVAFVTGWAPKNVGGGLCFQDTPCISLDYVASSLAVYMLGVLKELHDANTRKIHETEILDPLKIPGIKISYKKIQDLKTSIQI